MEEVEAYKRSLSAPWEKRSQIIPINKWLRGVGKAINFSYFSPYDVITKPIEACLKIGKREPQEVIKLELNCLHKCLDKMVHLEQYFLHLYHSQ